MMATHPVSRVHACRRAAQASHAQPRCAGRRSASAGHAPAPQRALQQSSARRAHRHRICTSSARIGVHLHRGPICTGRRAPASEWAAVTRATRADVPSRATRGALDLCVRRPGPARPPSICGAFSPRARVVRAQDRRGGRRPCAAAACACAAWPVCARAGRRASPHASCATPGACLALRCALQRSAAIRWVRACDWTWHGAGAGGAVYSVCLLAFQCPAAGPVLRFARARTYTHVPLLHQLQSARPPRARPVHAAGDARRLLLPYRAASGLARSARAAAAGHHITPLRPTPRCT